MFFKPIFIFSAIGITIYSYVSFATNRLVFEANDDLYISNFISLFCSKPFIHLLFLLIIIALISSLLFNSRYLRYLSYFLSLIILNMSWYITMDIFLLKNLTSYFLIKIYHPIPLEVKLNYLSSYLSLYYESAKLPLEAHPILEEVLAKTSIKTLLPVMDANCIQKYCQDCVHNTAQQYYNGQNLPIINDILNIIVFTLPFYLLFI
jgi:hypothetical protein